MRARAAVAALAVSAALGAPAHAALPADPAEPAGPGAPDAARTATPARTGEHAAPAALGRRISLRSTLRLYGGYNDIWGYTAPDGREYALVGTTTGVSVVNITDRDAPYETGFIAGPASTWRDIKTYESHMYIVNENDGGMQIVSLADPESPRPVSAYLGFRTAHNLYAEYDHHAIYVAGSNLGNGGVLCLSLSDPTHPRVRFTWDNVYAHDVHARGDLMYVAAINVATLYLVDIDPRDPAPPTVVGTIGSYPAAYTHAVWPTRDDRYVLTTDETPGASTRVWNVENPAAPRLAAAYRPPDSFDSVLDLTDPEAPEEAAFYDTRPNNDTATFSGCWGVFPYFPHSPGLVVASDIEQGLFVLELAPILARKEGPGFAPGAPPIATAGAAAPSRGPRPIATSTRPTPGGIADGLRRAEALVFDAAGRRIRTLHGIPGDAAAAWDRRDENGRTVAAGVYFIRTRAGDDGGTRRVVVIR